MAITLEHTLPRKHDLFDLPGSDDMHRRDRLRRRTAQDRADAPQLRLDGPPEGDRWSTYNDTGTLHGPQPRPDWVVDGSAAIDYELGLVKTGKEADVFLLERAIPETDRSTLLAVKRYRDLDHRAFRRDNAYLEGRVLRETRQRRAAANRSRFGRALLGGQWAVAEFYVLGALWASGAPVPYPVQLVGTELVMEWIGDDDGTAAPRLAETRYSTDELESLWHQCIEAMTFLARAHLAHGDLSAYNLLVDGGRLVMIDVPQAVDIVTNPRGIEFLYRDARNAASWFASHGVASADAESVMGELVAAAGLG